MFVLGIDPGLSRCGYASIDTGGPSATLRARALGVLTTPADAPLPRRLACLRDDFVELLAEQEPHVVVVEHVFFQVNVRTAMSVAQAAGLVLAEAYRFGCQVVQYTPNEVKHAVAGYGGATKLQVQRMVQVRLALANVPKPPDAADAAALALCHLAHAPLRDRLAAAAAIGRT